MFFEKLLLSTHQLDLQHGPWWATVNFSYLLSQKHTASFWQKRLLHSSHLYTSPPLRFYSHDSSLTGVPCLILAWLQNVAMFDKILQENLDSRHKYCCPYTQRGTFCKIWERLWLQKSEIMIFICICTSHAHSEEWLYNITRDNLLNPQEGAIFGYRYSSVK